MTRLDAKSFLESLYAEIAVADPVDLPTAESEESENPTLAGENTAHYYWLARYFTDLAKSVEKSNPEAADAWRLDALRNLLWAEADVRVEDLPSDWRVEWEECAAVMEYDGNHPRERAEALAMTEILRRLRESGKILY